MTTSLNMFIKTLVTVIALAATALSSPTSEASSSQIQTRVIEGEGWTVQGLTIDCDIYSYNPFCTYTFNIDVGGYTPNFSCCINDYAPDPQHSSWYSYPCNGEAADDGGWVISWGYNPTYDFAVMTVLSTIRNEDAWFGWNNISTTSTFQNVGPNDVYPIGTFT